MSKYEEFIKTAPEEIRKYKAATEKTKEVYNLLYEMVYNSNVLNEEEKKHFIQPFLHPNFLSFYFILNKLKDRGILNEYEIDMNIFPLEQRSIFEESILPKIDPNFFDGVEENYLISAMMHNAPFTNPGSRNQSESIIKLIARDPNVDYNQAYDIIETMSVEKLSLPSHVALREQQLTEVNEFINQVIKLKKVNMLGIDYKKKLLKSFVKENKGVLYVESDVLYGTLDELKMQLDIYKAKNNDYMSEFEIEKAYSELARRFDESKVEMERIDSCNDDTLTRELISHYQLQFASQVKEQYNANLPLQSVETFTQTYSYRTEMPDVYEGALDQIEQPKSK